MKQWFLGIIGIFAVAALALFSAQSKEHDYRVLNPLRVGLSTQELGFLGQPTSASANEYIYTLPDQSTLYVAISDNVVTGAWLQLKYPLKTTDKFLKDLRFVQMELETTATPAWFYAAAAGEGRIFKVSNQGFVETITWVKPFTVEGPSRQLQALVQEFTGKYTL